MRIAAAADWREQLPFETPMILAEVMPGDDTRCSVCGPASEPRSRGEMWVVKHRHPKHHDGHVRFYCVEHVPVVARRPEPAPAGGKAARAPRASTPRASTPRRAAASDRVRAMCPDCFIEVAANGVCGNCGATVSA